MVVFIWRDTIIYWPKILELSLFWSIQYFEILQMFSLTTFHFLVYYVSLNIDMKFIFSTVRGVRNKVANPDRSHHVHLKRPLSSHMALVSESRHCNGQLWANCVQRINIRLTKVWLYGRREYNTLYRRFIIWNDVWCRFKCSYVYFFPRGVGCLKDCICCYCDTVVSCSLNTWYFNNYILWGIMFTLK